MAPAALTPDTAIAWLRSLSIDLLEVAVLDVRGDVLAGDGAIRELVLKAPGEQRERGLLIVRSAHHVVAATVGPWALGRLAKADLRSALAALENG